MRPITAESGDSSSLVPAMDTFNYMRAFRRIVELGSLAKAAEDLSLIHI